MTVLMPQRQYKAKYKRWESLDLSRCLQELTSFRSALDAIKDKGIRKRGKGPLMLVCPL